MTLIFIEAVTHSALFQTVLIGTDYFINTREIQMTAVGAGTEIDQHIVVTVVR